MNCEYKSLLRLLASIFDDSVTLEALDFCADRLLLLARGHRVVIPAEAAWSRLAQAGRAPPVPAAWKVASAKDRLYSLEVAKWLGKLAGAFDEAGIAWTALKGPALSKQVYGDPGWRTVRDLDVIVAPDRVADAVEAARTLGWQAPDQWAAVMRVTGKIDVGLAGTAHTQPLLEIHNAFAPRHGGVNFGPIASLSTQRVKVGVRTVPALAGEDAIVFVAWHGAKHLWMRLNWLLDLAGLLKAGNYDPAVLVDRARKVGAEAALRGGILLANRLLHGPIPPMPLATRSMERAAERIADWGEARIALGPEEDAVGRRPWSYKWHLREARLGDRRSSLLSNGLSMLAPVAPDVRWLGPQRPLACHYAARPFLLGRRIVADLISGGR
ncbi:MAG: nucleotidyltransferase family protein [Sphingomonadales bacterium]|nr:nucleotidyltransferase family protein [Sphingomonadales bacterium]